jgi:hypothetical protein
MCSAKFRKIMRNSCYPVCIRQLEYCLFLPGSFGTTSRFVW